MSEWQPIESVPMDGTEVDLWVDGSRETNFRWREVGVKGWAKEEGYPSYVRILVGKPTHWMPLPPKP